MYLLLFIGLGLELQVENWVIDWQYGYITYIYEI